MSQCPRQSGDDIPGAAAGPHVAAPSFRMMRLFLGRSRQASFSRAAGNNIVPVFGRVGSHIWDRSIRNRPQCGTINPWPPQQICAVTAECRTINQTRREKPALSHPSLPRPRSAAAAARWASSSFPATWATVLSHRHWRFRGEVAGRQQLNVCFRAAANAPFRGHLLP